MPRLFDVSKLCILQEKKANEPVVFSMPKLSPSMKYLGLLGSVLVADQILGQGNLGKWLNPFRHIPPPEDPFKDLGVPRSTRRALTDHYLREQVAMDNLRSLLDLRRAALEDPASLTRLR